MKVIMLRSVLVLFFGSIFSVGAMAASPYIGGQLGWLDGSIEVTFFRWPDEHFKEDGAGFSGVAYSAFAGVKHSIPGDKFIAYELGIDSSSAEYMYRYSDSFGEDLEYFKRLEGLGISFLLGKDMNEFSPYVLVGIKLSYFERVNPDFGREKADHVGPEIGVGAMFNVTDQVRMRVDWSRVFYDDFDYSFDGQLNGAAFKPSESHFRLGVLRQF
jgi:opacity protein-like surface antigen